MNSINAQQEEDTFKPMDGQEAVKKIKELVKKAETCFLCTSIMESKAVKTRPMSVQDVDDEGNLWFLSASDSNQNREIGEDPSVQLFFQGSAHSDFLTLYGDAEISKDQQKIDQFWGPLLKTWFTEGKDDPRIRVIKFVPSEGYYWDTKHGKAVAFAKMVTGAVLGKTMDDSQEGTLNV